MNAKPKARDFHINEPITSDEIEDEIPMLLRDLARARINERRNKAFDDAMALWRWEQGIDR